MNTPIHDFVKAYAASAPARFHMPGHKGSGPLGCEELDITEIPGADSLYEASGIIAESERNASALFGCPTFYSTEGSSHCIRAMLLLAMQHSCRDKHCLSAAYPPEEATGNRQQAKEGGEHGLAMTGSHRFRVLAARNVHRTFLSAAALLDLDVVWLPAAEGAYLSAEPAPEALDLVLTETGAGAVYLTCPDYLGCLPDLKPLAEICHAHNALLLVDNAHGAYLRFLEPSRHPMDLGADLCCDSAHKTLPVLTGGAYLHVKATDNRQQATGDESCVGRPDSRPPQTSGFREEAVRDALALFGSTSPSYLILQSLDLANPYLERLPALLKALIPKIDALKRELVPAGYRLYGQEPLKLTLCPRGLGLTGTELAKRLETEHIFCEFSDPDYVVFMFTPNTPDTDLTRLREALLRQAAGSRQQAAGNAFPLRGRWPEVELPGQDMNCQLSTVNCQLLSLREAMLSPCQRIPASESLGRILARPCVSCPPAVPILMPGERIDEKAIADFRYYGIDRIDVL